MYLRFRNANGLARVEGGYYASTSNQINLASPGVFTSEYENKWLFVAFTTQLVAGEREVNLYVNGELVATTTSVTHETIDYLDGTATNLNIGTRETDDDFLLNGLIKHTFVYDRVVTQTELADMYDYMTFIDFAEANFENAVFDNYDLIDLDGDGKISYTEAAYFNGGLHFDNKSITDMSDLKYFLGLTQIYCDDNNFTTLDVRKNSELLFLSAKNNGLTSLNLANGNNLIFVGLDVRDNPDLTCIEVDNVQDCIDYWDDIPTMFMKDETASWNEDCDASGSDDDDDDGGDDGVDDGNDEDTDSLFDYDKYGLSIYPNPAITSLTIEINQMSSIAIVDVLGQVIAQYDLQEGANTINVNDLKSGIYFIKVADKQTIKFVKQ